MRQSRHAQLSILDFYAKHEHAQQLSSLSDLLDNHPIILTLIKRDFAEKCFDALPCERPSLNLIFLMKVNSSSFHFPNLSTIIRR